MKMNKNKKFCPECLNTTFKKDNDFKQNGVLRCLKCCYGSRKNFLPTISDIKKH